MWLCLGVPQGVVFKCQFTRAGQQFLIASQISDVPTIAATLLGTLVPSTIAYMAYNYIIIPYFKKNERQNLETMKERTKQKRLAAREEALQAVQMMKESVKQKVKAEERSNGFVVVRALYGKLDSGAVVNEADPECPIIDVTIPVQHLVLKSQLHMLNSSKSGLIGFYDCAYGEKKQLKIQYSFRGKLHEALINDDELLACPKRSHLIQ